MMVDNRIRNFAFKCLTNLMVPMPSCIMMKMEDIVKFLLSIIQDSDETIRSRIYTIFVTICEQRRDILGKYLEKIVNSMIPA